MKFQDAIARFPKVKKENWIDDSYFHRVGNEIRNADGDVWTEEHVVLGYGEDNWVPVGTKPVYRVKGRYHDTPLDELMHVFRSSVGTVIQYNLDAGSTHKRYCDSWFELCDRGYKPWCESVVKEEKEIVRKMRSKK